MSSVIVQSNSFGHELGMFVAQFVIALALIGVFVTCCACCTGFCGCKSRKGKGLHLDLPTDKKKNKFQLKKLDEKGKHDVDNLKRILSSPNTITIPAVSAAGVFPQNNETLPDNKKQISTSLSDKALLPDKDPELGIKKKKNYLYYRFDNLSKSPKSSYYDEEIDEYADLDDFVNIVLKSCDPNNDEVLLHISSPGGYAYKFEKSYLQVMRLSKKGFKVTALVDDICASGGYMLACACNRIVASKYSQIGSVGVIATVPNVYKLIDKIGVEVVQFTTGPYKGGFPTTSPYTDDDKARQGNEIKETFEVFKQIVSSARKDIDISEITSAKVWYADDAKRLNLIDEIDNIDDYLAKISKDNNVYLVYRVKKTKNIFSDLFSVTMANIMPSIYDNAIETLRSKYFASTTTAIKTKKIDKYLEYDNYDKRII